MEAVRNTSLHSMINGSSTYTHTASGNEGHSYRAPRFFSHFYGNQLSLSTLAPPPPSLSPFISQTQTHTKTNLVFSTRTTESERYSYSMHFFKTYAATDGEECVRIFFFWVCVCVCMHVWMFVCMYACVCVCTCVSGCGVQCVLTVLRVTVH